MSWRAMPVACSRPGISSNSAWGKTVATAPLGGIVQAEETQLPAAAEKVVREAPGGFPLVDVGPDLGLDEAAHRRPERVVLGGEDRMRGRHGKNAATSHVRS